MKRLTGRVAIVTGGARGIGRAISITLASEGASVAVNYHKSKDAAFEVVEEIKNNGCGISAKGDKGKLK